MDWERRKCVVCDTDILVHPNGTLVAGRSRYQDPDTHEVGGWTYICDACAIKHPMF